MEASYLELATSAVGGSCVATLLARAFIMKTLRDLEHAIEKIAEIRTELAMITTKLEGFGRVQDRLHEIDRKVIALETKIFSRNH